MIKGIIFDFIGVLYSSGNFIEENISLLKDLKEDYQLSILSNGSSNSLCLLEDRGVRDFFKVVIFSDEIGFEKPQTESYEMILSKMTLRPEEVIFIDDRSENIEGASLLGINTVYYKDPHQLREDLISLGIKI